MKSKPKLTAWDKLKLYEKRNKLDNIIKKIDDVEINVNNYVASCKMFTSSVLYMEIKALNESDKLITYQIPINLEDNCKWYVK